jgi:vacuolar-type H+-ATPase subunit D/Vma8
MDNVDFPTSASEPVTSALREMAAKKMNRPDPAAATPPAEPQPAETPTPTAPAEEQKGSLGLSSIDKKVEVVYKKKSKQDNTPETLDTETHEELNTHENSGEFDNYKGPKRNDWEKLKESAKTARQEAETLKSKTSELEGRATKAETELAELRERLKSYTELEGAVVLENSSEFKEAFIDRKNHSKAKALQVAEMNDVDRQIVEEALTKPSYREAVSLLNDYIADVSAFNDVKAQIQDYFLAQAEMEKALKSPDDYREIVKQKVQKERQEKSKSAKSIASSQINEAWKGVESFRNDDNQGLLSSAKSDVTTLVSGLIDEGVDLNAEAINTFAQVFARAYLFAERESIIADLKEQVDNLNKQISIEHPGVTNKPASSNAGASEKFNKGEHFNKFASKFLK